MDTEPADTPTRLLVRSLRSDDLSRIVAIDRHHTGRARAAWYQGRLKRALGESDLNISRGAELEGGTLVGAVLGSLHYGEFGQPEPLAVLDTLLVDPAFAGKGVGRAMMEQLRRNLAALRIERVRTEVAWNEQALIGFMAREGFVPAPRLVLELDLSKG